MVTVQLLDLNSANQKYLPTIFQPLAFLPPLFQSQFPGPFATLICAFVTPRTLPSATRTSPCTARTSPFTASFFVSNLPYVFTNSSLQTSSAFLGILQWWGKTAKGPIFLALPHPQNSMRSSKQNNNFSSLIVGCIIDPRPGLSTLSIDPFVSCVTHWCTIYNHYSTLLFFNHV